MVDRRRPAVHRLASHDAAAERRGNRLMTEADTKNRALAGPLADEIYRRASVFGSAGAGRDDDRSVRFGRSDRNTIASHDVNTRPELLQRLG